jgi:hypothetical protein
MGAVVYVIFFATAGAELDIPLLRDLWQLALLLGAVRMIVTFAAARVSSRLAKDSPLLEKWAWTSLVAQAGLTQGIANVVERDFPSFGAPFRSLVFANVAINAIVGPVLFKLGLDRTGETKGQAPALTGEDETERPT